jgi:hypothetical protein
MWAYVIVEQSFLFPFFFLFCGIDVGSCGSSVFDSSSVGASAMDDDWLAVDYPPSSPEPSLPSIHKFLVSTLPHSLSLPFIQSKSGACTLGPDIHSILHPQCEQKEFHIVHRIWILDVLYDKDSEDHCIRGSGFISEPVQTADVEEYMNQKAYFVWVPHSTIQMSEETEDEKGSIKRKGMVMTSIPMDAHLFIHLFTY